MDHSESNRKLARIALWILAGAALLAGLGEPPVRRTQEARVLVTAREMVVSPDGLRAWLVPHLNAHIRLEKPPLAYWLAGASMKLFGVNEFAGRLPTAIAGWLTLAVVYAFARRLFDAPTAVVSAAVLLTSYMFFRHSRLAETDALASLFVSLAVYWFWRFTTDNRPLMARLAIAHGSALGMALAILAKGPPAAFAALFFIAFALVARRPRRLLEWCISAAPLTLAIVALPWFIYIRTLPEWPIVSKELAIALRGLSHRGPFLFYFPHVLRATAPWCGLMVLALVLAIARWKRDLDARVALLWSAAIFVPLCFAGQKQQHYLVPLLPPLAVLVAWAIVRANQNERSVRSIFAATCIAMLVAGAAVPSIGTRVRGNMSVIDGILAFMLLTAAIVGLLAMRRRRMIVSAMMLAACVAVMFVVLVGWWEASLVRNTPRAIAAMLREHFGKNATYWYYGENESLPLAWSLRTVIRQAKTPQELTAAAQGEPRLVAIAQDKKNIAPPPPPDGFVEPIPPIVAEDQVFRFYVRRE